MKTFKLTENEIDIINEALSLYSEKVGDGKGWAYNADEVDEVAEKFN